MEQISAQNRPNFQQIVICNFRMTPNNVHQGHQPTPIIEPKSFNPKALNTIFNFIATFFLSLLQLKSQGDHAISPFSTNPYTILVSIVWVLLYCWAYTACSKPSPPLTNSLSSSPPPPSSLSSQPPPSSLSSQPPPSSLSSQPPPSLMPTPSQPLPPTIPLPSSSTTTKPYQEVYQEMMIIFGALTLTSLGSLLFPSSAQHYTLYTMYAIIGLGLVFHWARLCQKFSPAPRGNLLPLHTREIA